MTSQGPCAQCTIKHPRRHTHMQVAAHWSSAAHLYTVTVWFRSLGQKDTLPVSLCQLCRQQAAQMQSIPRWFSIMPRLSSRNWLHALSLQPTRLLAEPKTLGGQHWKKSSGGPLKSRILRWRTSWTGFKKRQKQNTPQILFRPVKAKVQQHKKTVQVWYSCD